MNNELKKHSQQLNLVLGVSGAFLAGLHYIKDDLGTYYGIVFVITSVISAFCVAKKQNLDAG